MLEAKKLRQQAQDILDLLLPMDQRTALFGEAYADEAVMYDYLVPAGLRISIRKELPATTQDTELGETLQGPAELLSTLPVSPTFDPNRTMIAA